MEAGVEEAVSSSVAGESDMDASECSLRHGASGRSRRWDRSLRRTLERAVQALVTGDARGAGGGGLAERARGLAASIDLSDTAWSSRLVELEDEGAALGCVLFATAHGLGAAATGWRHERRALEHLARFAFADGPQDLRAFDPRALPDLVARDDAEADADDAGDRAEWLALAVAFWIERHLGLGARGFEARTDSRGLLLRCDRGGDPCPELDGLPRVSTRRGAWLRLEAVRVESWDQRRPGTRRRLRS